MTEVRLVRTDLLNLAPHDVITGTVAGMVYDGARFQLVSCPASFQRDLIAPMSLWVSTTGSDTLNDGMSPATPFRTFAKALAVMNSFNNRGVAFTIYAADGVYEERVSLPTINGTGSCTLIGNDTAPWNVVIWDHTGSSEESAALLCYGINYGIHGFKFQSDYGTGLGCSQGYINLWNFELGYCGKAHLATGGGTIHIGSTSGGSNFYRVSGSTQYHYESKGQGSNIAVLSSPSIQPPALSIVAGITCSVWAQARYGGSIGARYLSIDGKGNVGSGYRYSSSENSVISTNGAGEDYFPGTIPGITGSGGVYS
jgi:hypothetical protein